MSLGVRNQLDCDVVDARIMSQRAGRQLRQFLIVAAGETRPDLPNVFLDDVMIVEQPLSGRTDVDATLCRIAKTIMYLRQHSSRIVETIEKRSVSALLSWRQKFVFARDVPRVFREPVRSENLTTNGPHEPAVCTVGCTAKQAQESGGACRGWDYCCHGLRYVGEDAGKLRGFAVFRSRDDERAGRVRVKFPLAVRHASFGGRRALAQVNDHARAVDRTGLDPHGSNVVHLKLKCRCEKRRRKKALHCTPE